MIKPITEERARSDYFNIVGDLEQSGSIAIVERLLSYHKEKGFIEKPPIDQAVELIERASVGLEHADHIEMVVKAIRILKGVKDE